MARRTFFSVAAAWAIPVCALTTIGVGLWGWLDLGFRFDNALYRALALFEVNNDAYVRPPGLTDPHFLFARWTGVATVFGAALYTIAALLHERISVAVARTFRQQVVVIGKEALAAKAFEAARGVGKSVVWVGAPTLEAFSMRELALPWPNEDPHQSIARYAAAADHVLLVEDDDANALVLARTARAVAPNAFITVLLRNGRLAEDAAVMINEPRTRVLSAGVVSTRALNVAHPPFMIAKTLGHKRIHALIVGFGQTGQAIARDLIVNCRTSYLGLPRITVIDPAAPALEGVMRVRAPELNSCAEFTFVEGRIGPHGVSPSVDALAAAISAGGPVTAAYVCRPVDAEVLGTAGMLQSLLRVANVDTPALFVRLGDASALLQSGGDGQGLNALVPFGELGALIEASEFLSNAPDKAARTFSAAYRASLPPERRNDPNNRSARPWDELDETFRQATRDAVAHIPAKMASADIDPALWLGVAGPPHLGPEVLLFHDDAELERLAELEHERWNAQRRMDGWRWAASRDNGRRLHPDLTTYEALSDQTKEYDRVNVRETQAVCHEAKPS